MKTLQAGARVQVASPSGMECVPARVLRVLKDGRVVVEEESAFRVGPHCIWVLPASHVLHALGAA